MSTILTHFHDRQTGEPMVLEVKRQKWFAFGGHEAVASSGVLELVNGEIRNANVYRDGHSPNGHRYVVSAPGRLGFWETVGVMREGSGLTFEHEVRPSSERTKK